MTALIHSRILTAYRDFVKQRPRHAPTKIKLGHEEYKELRCEMSRYLRTYCEYNNKEKREVVVTQFCGIDVEEIQEAHHLSIE